MTETNKQDLMATVRDALHQLDSTLDHTRAGVDAIASQVARLHEGVEAVSGLLQREVPSVAIDMLVDAATDLLAAFRELESGLLDAQGDVDTLEAALEEEEDGQQV
jgi:hypothetical protein